MNGLLDASACSHFQRRHKAVFEVLRRSATVAVPAIELGQLDSGFRGGNRWSEKSELLERFPGKSSVKIVNVTAETALRYAEIDFYLQKTGRQIPRNSAPLDPAEEVR